MDTSTDDQSQRGRAVSVWLADEDVAQLKVIAHEKGIGHTTLIRMWIRERLTEINSQEQRKGEQ
ncbi:MAG: hypothetical protein ABEL51_00610 [Salinibacter sp.]